MFDKYPISHFSDEQRKSTSNDNEESWRLSPFWVEDQRPHINPHRFGILMNNPRLCEKDEKVDLLIMVASAVDHQSRRDAIRETWASSLEKLNSKVIFLLGQGRDKQSKIQDESTLYKDIVQEDFEVSTYN